MKYQKYYEELEQIVAQLENGEIGIDELSTKIKRAQKLIDQCEKILTSTRSEVEKLLLNQQSEEDE